jgi:hypothetical protein
VLFSIVDLAEDAVRDLTDLTRGLSGPATKIDVYPLNKVRQRRGGGRARGG